MIIEQIEQKDNSVFNNARKITVRRSNRKKDVAFRSNIALSRSYLISPSKISQNQGRSSYRRPSSLITNLSSSLASPKDKDFVLVPFFDRVGINRPCHVQSGNICVVGASSEDLAEISRTLIQAFADSGKKLKTISPADFANINTIEQKDESCCYLTHIQTNLIDPTLMANCFKLANYSYVTQLPDLSIKCGLEGSIKSNKYTNNIIRKLGGDYFLRMYLIASLSRGECLVVNNDSELIRCFKKPQREGY